MNKKEVIRQYKERKTPQGIFAVRCTAADQVWVGASRNLDASKNGFWFSLRMGNHLDKTLQAAWDAHGEACLTFEVVETFKDDIHPLELKDLLKAKQTEWVARLGASKLL